MSALSRIGSALGSGLGQAAGVGVQVVNLAAGSLVGTLKDSDLIVLRRPSMQSGADTLSAHFRPEVAPVDFDALRGSRPLLHREAVTVARADRPLALSFLASAEGVDFVRPDATVAPISVYVNGRYHSDVMVMSERTTPYSINLAGLGAGTHDVELRASTDISPAGAPIPSVARVTTRTLDGDEALAARFAPVIETRATPGGDPRTPDVTHTDVPLVLASSVEHQPDGSARIRYNVLSSNEDGGTAVTSTFRRFGRATDYEPVTTVELDPSGQVVRQRFQGPVHVPYDFVGETVGERPVLRVGTRNGLFTSRLLHATPRWSELPTAPTPRPMTDRELMLSQPWTFAVMGKELIREGKSAPPGGTPAPGQVRDARDHLYFDLPTDPARQAVEGADELRVRVSGGGIESDRLPSKGLMPIVPGRPAIGTAIPLPPGVTGSDVTALVGSPGRVYALDRNFQPRLVPGTRGPAR